MRKAQLLVLLVAMVLLAGSTQANSIDDPQIIIRGTGSGNTLFLTSGTTVNITFGPSQVFMGPGGCMSFTPASQSSDGFDHLVCGVVNQTGSTLAGITFAVSPAFQLPLTLVCSFCTSVTATPDGAYITFLFPTGFFQDNDDFEIELVGFSQGTGIGITPVPEPGTIVLLGTGLGALGLFRRKRKA
jgi:hypothetical protein